MQRIKQEMPTDLSFHRISAILFFSSIGIKIDYNSSGYLSKGGVVNIVSNLM